MVAVMLTATSGGTSRQVSFDRDMRLVAAIAAGLSAVVSYDPTLTYADFANPSATTIRREMIIPIQQQIWTPIIDFPVQLGKGIFVATDSGLTGNSQLLFFKEVGE